MNPLRRDDLLPDPIKQFENWFQQAYDSKLIEPNAMSLATVSDDGQPTVRTVLLKQYNKDGFVFFTNYTSDKAKDLFKNPKVSLLFPWLALERQVIIKGQVEKISTAESLKYFLTRPRGSQLGAWVSNQSQIITNKSLLEMKLQQMKDKFSKGKIPLPDQWGGYRVKPHSLEFWQGRPNRLHDRFEYLINNDGNWEAFRKAP